MDADDVEGVVVAEPVLEADGQGAEHTGDGADGDRAERADRATGRGDGDQAGDRAGGRAERGEGAVADLLVRAASRACAAAVATWVLTNASAADAVVVAERGAGVEAEPAEPQQTGAEHDQRQAVRPHRVPLEADRACRGRGPRRGPRHRR